MSKYLNGNTVFKCQLNAAAIFIPVNPNLKAHTSAQGIICENCILNISAPNICPKSPPSTPIPCPPTIPADWKNKSTLTISGSSALKESCSTTCPISGGTIKPFAPTYSTIRLNDGAQVSQVNIAVPAVDFFDTFIY